jgi:hypothetical protein
MGGGATIATQPGAFTWQFDGVGNIILVRAYLPAHELLTWRKSRSVLRGDEPWFEWRTPSRLGAMLGRPTEVPKFRSARWLSSLQPPSHIRSSRSRCGHLLPTLLRLRRRWWIAPVGHSRGSLTGVPRSPSATEPSWNHWSSACGRGGGARTSSEFAICCVGVRRRASATMRETTWRSSSRRRLSQSASRPSSRRRRKLDSAPDPKPVRGSMDYVGTRRSAGGEEVLRGGCCGINFARVGCTWMT